MQLPWNVTNNRASNKRIPDSLGRSLKANPPWRLIAPGLFPSAGWWKALEGSTPGYTFTISWPSAMAMSTFLPIETPVTGLRPTVIQYGHILAWFHLQRPYFQIRFHSRVQEGQDLSITFFGEGTKFNPQEYIFCKVEFESICLSRACCSTKIILLHKLSIPKFDLNTN